MSSVLVSKVYTRLNFDTGDRKSSQEDSVNVLSILLDKIPSWLLTLHDTNLVIKH